MADDDYDERAVVGGRPPELDRYLALDLRPDGAIAQALASGVGEERMVDNRPIQLTNELSDRPAGFTAHMNSWYLTWIMSARHAALAAIRARFSNDRIRDIPTILIEADRDERKHRAALDKHQAVTDFDQNHSKQREERDEAQRDLERLKAMNPGREATVTNPVRYVLVLALLAAIDLAINWDTIAASPLAKGVPLFAVGLTIAAAVGIALASHIHGSLLRQFDYFFHAQEAPRVRSGSFRAGFGALALSAGMGIVAYARWGFLQKAITVAQMLGQPEPNAALLLAGSMMSNAVVYVLGCYWAFRSHDSDPEYEEVARRHAKLRTALDDAYRRLVSTKLTQIDERCRLELIQLDNRAAIQTVSPRYETNRALFAEFSEMDSRVCGLVQAYRNAVKRQHPNLILNAPDVDLLDPNRRKRLTVDEWSVSDLRLRYHGGGR